MFPARVLLPVVQSAAGSAKAEDRRRLPGATVAWEIAERPRAASPISFHDREPLDPALRDEILEQILEFKPHRLALLGDHPEETAGLLPLVCRASQSGVRVDLVLAAGSATEPGWLAALASAGASTVGVRLDSADAAIHEVMPDVTASYAATLVAARSIGASALGLHIATRLRPGGEQDFDLLAALVAEIDPVLWTIYPEVGVRGGDEFTPDEMEALLLSVARWAENHCTVVDMIAAPAFRRVMLQSDTCPRYYRPGRQHVLGDGRGYLFVDLRGDVWPSTLLPLHVGNVQKNRLASLYRSSEVLRWLRDPIRLEGKCAVCPYRILCGGSRARAFASTGNPFAEDPACAYTPPAAARDEGSGVAQERPS